MAAPAATWPREEMQTRKLGKGEGVSHGGPTREGNPGWGRFLAWGVRPPVWVQGFQQPRAGTGQPSRGGIPQPGFPPLPSQSRILALVGKLRLAGRDCISDGERDKWLDLRCRGLDLWQSFKDRLGFGGYAPPPKCSPLPG